MAPGVQQAARPDCRGLMEPWAVNAVRFLDHRWRRSHQHPPGGTAGARVAGFRTGAHTRVARCGHTDQEHRARERVSLLKKARQKVPVTLKQAACLMCLHSDKAALIPRRLMPQHRSIRLSGSRARCCSRSSPFHCLGGLCSAHQLVRSSRLRKCSDPKIWEVVVRGAWVWRGTLEAPPKSNLILQEANEQARG